MPDCGAILWSVDASQIGKRQIAGFDSLSGFWNLGEGQWGWDVILNVEEINGETFRIGSYLTLRGEGPEYILWNFTGDPDVAPVVSFQRIRNTTDEESREDE